MSKHNSVSEIGRNTRMYNPYFLLFLILLQNVKNEMNGKRKYIYIYILEKNGIVYFED